MKKLLYSLFVFLILLVACSKEEEVVDPPAPKQFTLAISAETGGTVSTEGGLYNEGSKIMSSNQSVPMNRVIELNLSDLNPGMYIVSVKGSTVQVHQKVIRR
jgi:hypothetical protein